jgi:hypothetical protein
MEFPQRIIKLYGAKEKPHFLLLLIIVVFIQMADIQPAEALVRY